MAGLGGEVVEEEVSVSVLKERRAVVGLGGGSSSSGVGIGKGL